MKFLTEEQVLKLKLNIQSYIWTTGFIELDLDESYRTPFGKLVCKPGFGWFFENYTITKYDGDPDCPLKVPRFPLEVFLENRNIQYKFDCPIINKLHKNRTFGLVFKLFGYPNNSKCWI